MSAIKKTYYITLDLRRRSDVQLKGIVEGDTGNVFVISLTEEGQPIAPADINAARVILKVKPSSGGSWAAQDSALGSDSGITIANGVITINLFAETYAAGWNTARLEIYTDDSGDDDTLVTTQYFSFEADAGGKTELYASAEYPILIKMINELDELMNGIKYPSGAHRDPETQHLIITFTDGEEIDVGALVEFVGNSYVGENLLYNSRPHWNSIGGELSNCWVLYRNRTFIEAPEIIEGEEIKATLPASPDEVAIQLQRVYAQESTDLSYSSRFFPYANFIRDLVDGQKIVVSFEIKCSNRFRLGVSMKVKRNGNVLAAMGRERNGVVTDIHTSWQRYIFTGVVPAGWAAAVRDPERAYFLIDLRTTSETTLTADTVVEIRKIKIERGLTFTEWSPAYADLDEIVKGAVRYTDQNLSDVQRGQALANVGIFYGPDDPEDVVDLLKDGDIYLQIGDPVESNAQESEEISEELSNASGEADSQNFGSTATMESEEG